MSFYKKIAELGQKFMPKHILYRYGFNYSPMYRRTTGRIIAVSEDLMQVRIKIPLNWKNRNYVNSIFGGSLFSAVDPIPMVQLINIIGDDYVVWDKATEIRFRRPARETVYGDFVYTIEELKEIKNRVSKDKEIDIIKKITLTNEDGSVLYCEIDKTLYIADKVYYKDKRRSRV